MDEQRLARRAERRQKYARRVAELDAKRLARNTRAEARQVGFRIKDGHVSKIFNLERAPKIPLRGARASMYDGTGKRVSLTRVVATGGLGFAWRKTTGKVTVSITGTGPDGPMTLHSSIAQGSKVAHRFVTDFNALYATGGEPADA